MKPPSTFDDERELPSEEILALLSGELRAEERPRVARALERRPELFAMARQASPWRERRAPRRIAWALAAAGLLALFAFAPRGGDPDLGAAVAALRRGDFAAVERELDRALGEVRGWSPHGALRSARSGGAAQIELLEPDGYALEPRPRFAWSAPSGAGPFELRLEDEDGELLLLAECAETAMDPPPELRALAPGEAFRVSVADLAERAGETSGVFVVAGGDTRRLIEEGLLRISAATQDVALARLAKARWLAHHRARGAARRELGFLFAELRPEDRPRLRVHLEARGALELAPPDR